MQNRRNRRKFGADFKAKVVIEALKERSSIEELAKKYELHPNQITTWKKEFLANAAAAFEKNDGDNSLRKERDEEIEKLYAKIGRIEIENDFLKKKLE
jgi:transposase